MSNKLLYKPVYPAKSKRYTRKGTLCAGIKLYNMAAFSTLRLPVQSHSGFRLAT